MFCEAFHRVFKYNYLRGKQNKRVDKCLVNLLKHSRDKTFERVIKLTKGKVTRCMKMVKERYQSSLLLNFADVEQGNEGEWKIKSCKNTYTVKLAEEECTGPNCVEKCIDCNVCLHRYVCTCTDFLLYCVMCKHIHLVHRKRAITEMNCENVVDDQQTNFEEKK